MGYGWTHRERERENYLIVCNPNILWSLVDIIDPKCELFVYIQGRTAIICRSDFQDMLGFSLKI